MTDAKRYASCYALRMRKILARWRMWLIERQYAHLLRNAQRIGGHHAPTVLAIVLAKMALHGRTGDPSGVRRQLMTLVGDAFDREFALRRRRG